MEQPDTLAPLIGNKRVRRKSCEYEGLYRFSNPERAKRILKLIKVLSGDKPVGAKTNESHEPHALNAISPITHT